MSSAELLESGLKDKTIFLTVSASLLPQQSSTVSLFFFFEQKDLVHCKYIAQLLHKIGNARIRSQRFETAARDHGKVFILLEHILLMYFDIYSFKPRYEMSRASSVQNSKETIYIYSGIVRIVKQRSAYCWNIFKLSHPNGKTQIAKFYISRNILTHTYLHLQVSPFYIFNIVLKFILVYNITILEVGQMIFYKRWKYRISPKLPNTCNLTVETSDVMRAETVRKYLTLPI